jgi:hypothetical protein
MTDMRKIEKPSPTESSLLFELDPKPAEETLTALGGLPLVVQAFTHGRIPKWRTTGRASFPRRFWAGTTTQQK